MANSTLIDAPPPCSTGAAAAADDELLTFLLCLILSQLGRGTRSRVLADLHAHARHRDEPTAFPPGLSRDARDLVAAFRRC